jgi:thiol-disulfide isomerase/thioredoxin
VLVCISYYAEHWNARFLAPLNAILLAMVVGTALPFLITLVLATKDYRRQMLSLSGKIAVVVAAVSLIFPAWAAYRSFVLWRASRNVMLQDVPAPAFSTLDLDGVNRSLSEQKGKVVLINVWATWCSYCRAEMPELDQLYREYKDQGLMVFGLSDEDAPIQRKCLEKIPVAYPLLTYKGEIPAIYRQVAAYPTTFLIDRQGQLQRGVEGEKSFAELEGAAISLLGSNAANSRPLDKQPGNH